MIAPTFPNATRKPRFQSPIFRARSIAPVRNSSPALPIAETTGPLEILRHKKVILLADVENLSGGARDLNYKLSYHSLLERLQSLASACSAHAFFSRESNDDSRIRYFSQRGWLSHTQDIRAARTIRGIERTTNSDNLFLFYAGLLVSRSEAEVVILGSGDGGLVCDTARFIAGLPKHRTIVTLSLTGSTSYRLDATTNPEIEANLEIGLDCLRPIHNTR